MPYADPEKRRAYASEYHRKRYKKHREEILAHNRTYYEDHKETVRAQREAYREANKDALREKRKAYYEAHRAEGSMRRKLRVPGEPWRCPKCGVEKPSTSEFWPRNRNQTCGFAAYCFLCFRAYKNRINQTLVGRVKHRANTARWCAENIEARRDYRERYYKENREVLCERARRKQLAVSYYDGIFRDIILSTFLLLPSVWWRRAFAVGMIHDGAFKRIAVTWPAVEDEIVEYTKHLSCSS